MFRVISLNANGIRAAARKGFFEWMGEQSPDVVCIQETKAQVHQLSDECFNPQGYHCFYEDAVKKGYSGVAIYSRQEPTEVIRGFGEKEFDDEGRYLEVRLGKMSVVSVYLPSGSSGEERQQAKFRFLDAFTPHLEGIQQRGNEVHRVRVTVQEILFCTHAYCWTKTKVLYDCSPSRGRAV